MELRTHRAIDTLVTLCFTHYSSCPQTSEATNPLGAEWKHGLNTELNKQKIMELKTFIFSSQFSLICLSIPWFFEPRMDYEDNTKLISAHANLLDSILTVPQSSVSVRNLNENYELGREGKASLENDDFQPSAFKKKPTEERVESETQKYSNGFIQDYVDPQRFSRQSFSLRPFGNLGRNFGFQIPSSTFSKTDYYNKSTKSSILY